MGDQKSMGFALNKQKKLEEHAKNIDNKLYAIGEVIRRAFPDNGFALVISGNEGISVGSFVTTFNEKEVIEKFKVIIDGMNLSLKSKEKKSDKVN